MREDLKQREEQKRDAAYDPVQRWKHIQATITWAEANLPPEKRRNRPRFHPANGISEKDFYSGAQE